VTRSPATRRRATPSPQTARPATANPAAADEIPTGGDRRTVPTPHGDALVHLHSPDAAPRGLLALGHGAGGGVHAADLQVAARAGLAAGMIVALVEQPYRVAGRRAPAPAGQLDTAWLAVLAHLRDSAPADGLPLVTGGRSSGARVACRTAAEANATAVLCLAFPVHPPGRPERDRLAELDAVPVPVLVVQGDRDPFGRPPRRRGRKVLVLAGDHALRAEHVRLGREVGRWLDTRLGGDGPTGKAGG
jgi:hypothetical protein